MIEGCLSSSADLLMIMDADLQHDESKILEMIKIQKKYKLDLVVGSRFLGKKILQPYLKKEMLFQNLQIGWQIKYHECNLAIL